MKFSVLLFRGFELLCGRVAQLPQFPLRSPRGIVMDGAELVLHPALDHWLQTVQLHTRHRARFPHKFDEFVAITSIDAITLQGGNRSLAERKNGMGMNELEWDLLHYVNFSRRTMDVWYEQDTGLAIWWRDDFLFLKIIFKNVRFQPNLSRC